MLIRLELFKAKNSELIKIKNCIFIENIYVKELQTLLI